MEVVGVIDYSVLGIQIREIFNLNIFVLLMALVVVDFITGTTKAFITKEMDSSIGIKGLLKHLTIIIIVAVFLVVTTIGNVETLGYAFTVFYLFEYCISIMENTSKLGVPYPEWIKEKLPQMKEKYDNWGQK